MSWGRLFISIIIVLVPITSFGQKMQSALKNGQVYKLTISESGIYKIDLQFIEENNIDIGNNSQFQIFGQKGGLLPEPIEEARTDGLIQLPLYKMGTEDGTFDAGDFVFFYAEGADVWKNPNNVVDYQKNIYDENNYIFLVVNGETAKNIEQTEPSETPEYSSSTFEEFQRFEVDKINPLGVFPTTHGSGQKWYGDEFTNLREKDYSNKFDFDGIDLMNSFRIRSEFIGRSNALTSYEISVNGKTFAESIGSVQVGDVEAIHARTALIDEVVSPAFDMQIVVRYPRVSSTSTGWLDYIQIQFRKHLAFSGDQFIFRDLNSLDYDVSEFRIDGSDNGSVQVWNITDRECPIRQNLDSDKFSYKSKDRLQSFVIFDPAEINLRPNAVEQIVNQDLHGIVDADMVIIYAKPFEDAAKRLADHRSNHSSLLVEAVEVSKIYNEFSSGRQDPTAMRDFARMLYVRSENFRHLLLFGDGSYDFRGINTTLPYQSFVATYETVETLDPLAAFPSDDYFAQLDDNEGVDLRGDLDISVGRLPARSSEEADILVDKIISYDLDSRSLGEWRSRIAFLADDEDSNLHLNDADQIAKTVLIKHPQFNQKKIYWDAFPQESTPGGNRYPAANQQLNTDIEEGLLVVNYLGHGGPKGWSQERVLNLDDIVTWSNSKRLPLVITATCSFTGFDDPSLTTAGEATIHNPTGGAIALFTTVRSVYASQNFRLTKAVFDTLFTKVDNEFMTIGEVMRRAKNTRVSDVVNARKFFLIGDPSLKLAIPKYTIETVEFNGSDQSTRIDTIGALQRIHVKAAIKDFFGEVDRGFNGNALITLFDKASTLRTLRNDPSSFEKAFQLQKNVLFRGNATVTNGEFEFSFIVPLDIDYNFGRGRLSYYAISDTGIDAGGYFENFAIGGTATNAIVDNEGPEIDIKLNNQEFESGDITVSNPRVLTSFYDESGINVSNVSIGHEIIGFVDDDSRSIEVLNDRYVSEIDDFTKGTLNYRLENVGVGKHILTIRAFDILNNAGESSIQFEVVDNLDGFLENVSVFPNPFWDQTTFSIENELGGVVNLSVNFYDLNGRLVHQINRNGLTIEGIITGITWDGSHHSGYVSNGIYLYEVVLQSLNSSKRLQSPLKKIVILK